MSLHIQVQPGFVSAFLFILFDLVLLTLIDQSISKLLSCYYYHLIHHHGRAIRIHSVDIPSVTSFNLGSSIISPGINILTLLLKIAILVCILVVDLNIDAGILTKFRSATYSSRFRFDLSEEDWGTLLNGSYKYRRVRRLWLETRRCSFRTKSNITYYPLAFNLSTDPQTGNETFLEDETQIIDSLEDISIVDLNESTVQCLSPNFVDNSNKNLLATVSSCSEYDNITNCNTMNLRKISIDLPILSPLPEKVSIPDADMPLTYFAYNFSTEIWGSKLPQYNTEKSYMVCSRTKIGLQDMERSNPNYTKIVMECIFYVPNYKNRNETLFEHWSYDERNKLLTRQYPGPCFEGIIKFSLRKAVLLLKISEGLLDFATFSSIIFTEGTAYERFEKPYTARVKQPKTIIYTALPSFAVGITVALCVFTLLFTVFSYRMLRGDKRSQLNSVGGLSSILREEHAPTGRSYFRGKYCILGIIERPNGHLRFGPLNVEEVKNTVKPSNYFNPIN